MYTYLWTFGDGASSDLQNPTHVYLLPGTYTWVCTLTINGTELTRSGVVVVLGADMFLPSPEWGVEPDVDFDYMRDELQYPGTKIELTAIENRLPYTLKCNFRNLTKSAEYVLLTWWFSQRGRYEKFWLPMWKNSYSLYADITAGDTIIYINQCNFHLIDIGYEHLYILTKAGNYVIMRVDAVVNNGDYETVVLREGVSASIRQSDIRYFSRLFLVRFDNDALAMRHINDSASECTMTFRELINEYDEES